MMNVGRPGYDTGFGTVQLPIPIMPDMVVVFLTTVIVFCLARESSAMNDVTDELDQIFEYVPLDGNATDAGHPCSRHCVKDSPRMICRYHFKVEEYHTMSKACYDCPVRLEDCDRPHCIQADGVPRGIIVVNRRLPGPSIEVCLGDRVVIDVQNDLMSGSTSVHWHGHHQRDTPYMDGVPRVTQCPITPGVTFRYQFDVRQAGTHFWHSHSGMQRSDGAFGSFVVRTPPEFDPHSTLYDYDLPEHVIVVMDWAHELGLDKFLAHHHADGDNKPANLLVNGKGRFRRFPAPLSATSSSATEQPAEDDDSGRVVNMTKSADDDGDLGVLYTPTARFAVEQGYRYRFRVINAEFLNCPIEVSVDNHTIAVIASDGFDTEPIEVDSFITYAGERFDFILNADQDVDNYWMRFRGLMDCGERFNKAHQVAVLHYEGADESGDPELEYSWELNERKGLQLNAVNRGPGHNDSISVAEMRSTVPRDPSLEKLEPDYKFYVAYDFYAKDNPKYHVGGLYGFDQVEKKGYKLYTPQLNHITLKLPPFPVLAGGAAGRLAPDAVCNETSVRDRNCTHEFCECTHMLSVRLNSVVEMVLVDQGYTYDANHPFHLHGYGFRVVAMGKMGPNVSVDRVRELDEMGLIPRNLDAAPPLKDTVTVPDGGFTVIRFYADNPGYWLFHCHIEFHVELGMALIFKVGEDREMPPPPPHFPECYDWLAEPEDGQSVTTTTTEGGSTNSSTSTTSAPGNGWWTNQATNHIVTTQLMAFLLFSIIILMS